VEELKKRVAAIENKPAPVMDGGKLDMNELYNIFAMKTPPESTIDRIKALEELTQQTAKELKSTTSLAENNKERLDKLEPCVTKDHEERITELEKKIEALQNVQPVPDNGNVDTGAIMMKIQML